MNCFTTAIDLAIALVLLFGYQAFADEHSALGRVTVYWRGEGSDGDRRSSNGARLLERHCAVDPKKIPYGSKLSFRMQSA